MDADVIIVGAGLAGLVAAAELSDAGRRIIIVEQEPEVALGGQAYWSFGGLFLVNSPEQRRLGIRDSRDLAMRDWLGSAGFDRDDRIGGRDGEGRQCPIGGLGEDRIRLRHRSGSRRCRGGSGGHGCGSGGGKARG